MKIKTVGLILAASTIGVSADTIFLGGDVLTPANWDKGLPTTQANPGTMNVNGTFATGNQTFLLRSSGAGADAAKVTLTGGAITKSDTGLLTVGSNGKLIVDGGTLTSAGNIGFNRASFDLKSGSISASIIYMYGTGANVLWDRSTISGGTLTTSTKLSLSAAAQVKELYFSGGTIHVGTALETDNAGGFFTFASNSTATVTAAGLAFYGTTGYINFETGSQATLSIAGYSYASYSNLYAANTLRFNGDNAARKFDEVFEVKGSILSLIPEMAKTGVSFILEGASSTKLPDAPAGGQQAAFGVEHIKLGGVFGHRIDTMIKGNLFKIDMEGTFLSYFREKKETGGVRSLGKTLDAAVHLAAYSGDPELNAWKNHWIDELISTQEPDGYIGIYRAGNRGTPTPNSLSYDNHEKGQIILALVNDFRFFGRTNSLQAAKKLAGEIMTTWTVLPNNNTTATFAYPIVMLSEVSGDESYAKWVREQYLSEGKLTGLWPKQLGGHPLSPLNMEGLHIYCWCDATITMLKLNRFFPDPALLASGPQLVNWLKDGGSLPQGSFAWNEKFRRSQTTRSGMEYDPEFMRGEGFRTKCGESCAKFYLTDLLDRLLEEKPDSYFGDVIERTYYNGLFAAQTPDGRHLAYDLSVEGTRVLNPFDHYCCPGNLRRAFAYLPGYIYRQLKDGIYVNLYTESDATLVLDRGVKMKIKQVTDYPVSGNIRVEVDPSAPVKTPLVFRIPAWCDAPSVKLNGKAVADVKPGTFLRLDREWEAGDVIALDFPMKWRWVKGIREQEGRACLLRGPVAYTLNPFRSGLDWYQDMQIDGWPIQKVIKKEITIPNQAEHLQAFARLEEITLDPGTISAPTADTNIHPFGQSVTVKGWLGEPKGAPDQTFTFTEFVDPQGRKVFFKLSDLSVAVDDELFGKEIHEKTVYPARWEAVKQGLDAKALAQVPDSGLDQALLVKPMRGSYEAETAQGELGCRTAWMSASLAKTGKRRMEFRVHDEKFQNSACSNVTLSVLYLDKGDCKVSLIYDSGDEVVRVRGRAPGAFKPGGDFQIGNTGTIKRHDFQLPDARFAKNLLLEGTDFRLVADKEVDFVILGAWLQPATK
jgi:hypothetical protein